MDTFETKEGRTLTLKPVKPHILWSMLNKFGSLAHLFDNPESIKKLKGRPALRAMGSVDQLFNYCAGFGVTDDPTEDELDELAEMGWRVDKPHLARVSWLRFMLKDDEEAGQLMGAVMTLTLKKKEMEDEAEKESVDDDKARIAELERQLEEAKLASIEGESEPEEDGS